MNTMQLKETILKTIFLQSTALLDEWKNDTKVVGLSARERNIGWFESRLQGFTFQVTHDIYSAISSTTYRETITIDVAEGKVDGPDQTICWTIVICLAIDGKLYADATNAKGAVVRWTSIPDKMMNKLAASVLVAEYRPWIPSEPKRTKPELEMRGINV